MVDSIKISIIMASFNRVKVIEQAISSVVNQTYNNIEFIIIDGGSTDGTLDIIKKYEDKIAYWVSEPDDGIYDALNKGIKAATGDYIYFLGTDDALYNDNVICDIVNDLSDTDIYSGAVYCVEGLDKQFIRDGLDENYTGVIPHQGMFVKAEFLKNREFDTSYKIVADYEHYVYMIKELRASIKRVPKVIAFYSLEGISSTDSKMISESNRVCEKYGLPVTKIHPVKEVILKVFDMVGILNWQRGIRGIRSYKAYVKHNCNNKICRWCGRGL